MLSLLVLRICTITACFRVCGHILRFCISGYSAMWTDWLARAAQQVRIVNSQPQIAIEELVFNGYDRLCLAHQSWTNIKTIRFFILTENIHSSYNL